MATNARKETGKYRKGTPKKRFNPTPWLIGLGVALLILVPTGWNVYQRSQLPGERFPSQGNAHISEGAPRPDYNSNPPTSGPHYPNLAGWGSYDYELPDPLLVHNLEDGGVILWYKSGTPEENRANIEALEAAFDAGRYRRVVIAPRSDLETNYAMTAWQRLDTFDEIDPERIEAFLEAFEGIDHHPTSAG